MPVSLTILGTRARVHRVSMTPASIETLDFVAPLTPGPRAEYSFIWDRRSSPVWGGIPVRVHTAWNTHRRTSRMRLTVPCRFARRTQRSRNARQWHCCRKWCDIWEVHWQAPEADIFLSGRRSTSVTTYDRRFDVCDEQSAALGKPVVVNRASGAGDPIYATDAVPVVSTPSTAGRVHESAGNSGNSLIHVGGAL
jgi:hypothetical protein